MLRFILWVEIGLLFSAPSTMAHADSQALYVSAESVLSMTKRRQDALLVDVRDRGAFDRLRIPGSIHIPLYSLKTKTFLRDKPLVLVSEGYPDAALEVACGYLRHAGFPKASILNGGLRSWMQKQGPVEGDALAAQEVNRVQPKQFFTQKDLRTWLVVAATDCDIATPPPLIAGTVYLRLCGEPRRFVSALKALINSKTEPFHPSVLICDENEDNYEGIERAVKQQGAEKIFYLKGGLKAYRAFLHQQTLLTHPGKEEVKRCVNCQ